MTTATNQAPTGAKLMPERRYQNAEMLAMDKQIARSDAYWGGYLSEAIRGLLTGRATLEHVAGALAEYDRWLAVTRPDPPRIDGQREDSTCSTQR